VNVGRRRGSPASSMSGKLHAGALLLALEDGFRLHRLIDPAGTPADAFARAVHGLQRLAMDRPRRGAGADET
jgi:hypothetical protein